MQMAVVESVNTAVPSILEGSKTAALKDPKYDFGAMKTFAKWKPTNGQGGALARLKEGLEGSWQQIKGALEMFLQASPTAKGVMLEMLVEIKIHTSANFCHGDIAFLRQDSLQDWGRSATHKGSEGVLLGPGDEATQDHYQGGSQGLTICGRGSVIWHGFVVGKQDVFVRGHGGTSRFARICILRLDGVITQSSIKASSDTCLRPVCPAQCTRVSPGRAWGATSSSSTR
jgi:hypothetical protein